MPVSVDQKVVSSFESSMLIVPSLYVFPLRAPLPPPGTLQMTRVLYLSGEAGGAISFLEFGVSTGTDPKVAQCTVLAYAP